MGIGEVHEKREGSFPIHDKPGNRIADFHYTLNHNGEHFAHIRIHYSTFMGDFRGDHDIHYFEDGNYAGSKLAFPSLQALLKEEVSLVRPGTRGYKGNTFDSPRVYLKDFSLDDEVREAFSNAPEEHLPLITKLIGNYL